MYDNNVYFIFSTGNILSTLVTFDREEMKEYRIPVAITDSGTPRLTGVSNLHVVIGDKNDNPMKPGHSDIFVYNYKVRYIVLYCICLPHYYSLAAYLVEKQS